MSGDLWHSNLPRKGWIETDVIDTQNYGLVCCEFCGTKLRYVHEINHPELAQKYNAGCDCAEKLTDDYVGPKTSEDRLRKRAGKKLRWIKSPKWVLIDYDWHRTDRKVVIFKTECGSAWKLIIGGRQGKIHYPTLIAAKIAAFDYIYPQNP